MKTKNIRNLFLLFYLTMLISGCATVEKPVVKESIMNVGTLATVAARRFVIVRTEYNKEKILDSKFCSEPPPDITENILSNLSLQATGSGQAQMAPTADVASLQLQAKIELAKVLQTTAQHLFKRTQGVQLYRDGLYNLCQACLNRTIGPETYEKFYEDLVNKSVKLIESEIIIMPELSKHEMEIRLSEEKTKLEEEKRKQLEVEQNMKKDAAYFECIKGKLTADKEKDAKIVSECKQAVYGKEIKKE